MPNPHAIYLCMTRQARPLFNSECGPTAMAVSVPSALSSLEGMTMAILGAQLTPEEAVQISTARQYKRVTMTRTFPVYITYSRWAWI